MRGIRQFWPTLAGLGLLAAGAGSVAAGDALLPSRPELVPTEVAVTDLGQSSRLDASIPYNPGLTSWVSKVIGPPPLPSPDQQMAMFYPLARPAEGLDPWGWRFSESRGRWRMHTGLDLMAPRGTPVLAALPGRVHLVSWIDGYGITIVLDHGNGRRTLYAHLESVAVLPGQELRGGDVMAAVGMTGRTSGPHLHFELRNQVGSAWVARDPTPLIPVAQSSPLLAADRLRLSTSTPSPLSFLSPSLPPPQLPPLAGLD
jgi:murein DD-endopeptidase MepM/ murein hydrolase activator NlpD